MAQLAQERDSERNKFVDFHKKNAVIEKLGGFKKPEYTKFINTQEIEVREDGSVDENSVMSQVEKIRKEYPELIKVSPKTDLPNAAPRVASERPYSALSEKERYELKLKLAQKDKK